MLLLIKQNIPWIEEREGGGTFLWEEWVKDWHWINNHIYNFSLMKIIGNKKEANREVM